MTVMDYLQELEGFYHKHRIDLRLNDIQDLENKLGTAYESYRKNEAKHSDEIFNIFLSAKNIDQEKLNEYKLLVEKLGSLNYKVKDNNIVAKLAHKTSSWYNGLNKPGVYSNDDLDQYIFSGVFYIFPSAILGLAVSPWTIPAVPILWYCLFKHKTELKGPKYKFQNDARDVVGDFYRLNYLSQLIGEQTKDIEPKEESVEDFVSRNGAENIRNSVKKVQDEVEKIRHLSEYILKYIGIMPAKLQTPKPITRGHLTLLKQ